MFAIKNPAASEVPGRDTLGNAVEIATEAMLCLSPIVNKLHPSANDEPAGNPRKSFAHSEFGAPLGIRRPIEVLFAWWCPGMIEVPS
jgi:hypothetical protein